MGNNIRFPIDIQEGKTTEETVSRLMQQLIRLAAHINGANIPFVRGPNQELPEGIQAGQPIIDYSSGATVLKTWDGNQLV